MRKVAGAANFFVQLIEQEPGIYDKRYPMLGRTKQIWKGKEFIMR
jgi:hypothetical protein